MNPAVYSVRRSVHILAFCLATLILPPVACAQSLPDLLSTLGIQELARDYLRPGADAVGYSLNSGLYHSARVDSGLHLWIGIRGVWTYVPENDRSFDATLPSSLVSLGYPERITTATIFGDEGAVLRSSRLDPTGAPYPDVQLPRGTGLRSSFVMIPHMTMGSFAATEIMLRGIPPVTYDPEIGKISFIGVGVKHSPSHYLRLPVDLSLMVAAQRLEIGEVLHVTNLNANIHASIPIVVAELYGGLGYESYSIDAGYTYTPTSAALPPSLQRPYSVSLHFERMNYRFTTGVNLTFLPLVNINAEYSFGVQDNLTIGAGVRL